MTWLLLGANGQVGHELHQVLGAHGKKVLATTRSGQLADGSPCLSCDLAEPGSVAALIGTYRPSVVLNATAYTAVDRAETEVDLAKRINAQAVGEIGESARGVGARVVHFSTDYVFAGDATHPYREDDIPAPASAYGRSKLDGEHALANTGAEYLLLRVAWVYAPHGHNFLRTMLRLGAERDTLRVVADQIGAPTPAHWIAKAALQALDADALGCFHLAPEGSTSWHGFAQAIFAGASARGLLRRIPQVDAIATSDYPTPARRPAWSVLDSGRLARDTGIRLPHWTAGVDEVLDALVDVR